MRCVALLLLCGSSHAWWKDEDTKTRGPAPYPYPATHKDGTAPQYDTPNQEDGIVEGKINVHLVPHTHDDTGWQVTYSTALPIQLPHDSQMTASHSAVMCYVWQVTVDQYFFTEVYYVVDTVVDQLVKNPKRHFIYVETGFFARWWEEVMLGSTACKYCLRHTACATDCPVCTPYSAQPLACTSYSTDHTIYSTDHSTYSAVCM